MERKGEWLGVGEKGEDERKRNKIQSFGTKHRAGMNMMVVVVVVVTCD